MIHSSPMPTAAIPFDPQGPPIAMKIRISGGQECNFQVAFFPRAGARGSYLAEHETTRGGESREIVIPEPPPELNGDYLIFWLGPYGPDLRATYRIRVTFSQGGRHIHDRSYRGTIDENPAGHVDDGRFVPVPVA